MGYTSQPIGNTWLKRKQGETYAQHRARTLPIINRGARLAALGIVLLILAASAGLMSFALSERTFSPHLVDVCQAEGARP